MAKWIELTAMELFEGGSKKLWTGLTETSTVFVVDPGNHDRGLVIKTSQSGKILWGRVVVKGNHAYRITAGGVKRLPLIENDPDAVRRLARTLGWPLTRIMFLSEGEVFSYRPRHQGDNGEYELPEGQNVTVVTFWTNGNPEWVTRIFVRNGSSPSWEEVKMALCVLAQRSSDDPLPSFEEAVYKF